MEGWKKADEMCRQMVMELAGICEVTKGKVVEKERHQLDNGEEEHYPHVK